MWICPHLYIDCVIFWWVGVFVCMRAMAASPPAAVLGLQGVSASGSLVHPLATLAIQAGRHSQRRMVLDPFRSRQAETSTPCSSSIDSVGVLTCTPFLQLNVLRRAPQPSLLSMVVHERENVSDAHNSSVRSAPPPRLAWPLIRCISTASLGSLRHIRKHGVPRLWTAIIRGLVAIL